MKKIIGITINGIEEECRWNKTSPCPRHNWHKGQKLNVKNNVPVFEEDDYIDPMGLFVEDGKKVAFVFEKDLYHFETAGRNANKYVLCKDFEFCTYNEHIDDKEYRSLQFNFDDRVSAKDAKKLVEAPTLKEIAEDFVAYRTYSRQIKSRKYYNRNVVLPEGLTEGIAAYCFNGKLLRGMSGDIMLPDGAIGEVKGSSSTGPNSFSPSEWFDDLIYVKYDLNDTFEVYDLRRTRADIEHIEVKKGQTFKEQAEAGRRPRFKIFDEIVVKENLKPTFRVVFDGETFQVS